MEKNPGIEALWTALLTILLLSVAGCLGSGGAAGALPTPSSPQSSMMAPGITKGFGPLPASKPVRREVWNNADRLVAITEVSDVKVLEVSGDHFAKAPELVARQLFRLPFLIHDVASAKGSTIKTLSRTKFNASVGNFNSQLENLLKKQTSKTTLNLLSSPSSPPTLAINRNDVFIGNNFKPIFLEEGKQNNFVMKINLVYLVSSNYDKIANHNKNINNLRKMENIISYFSEFDGYGLLTYTSNIYPAEKWLANDGQFMGEELNRAMNLLLEAMRQDLFAS